MVAVASEIYVALITVIGGIIVALLERSRRQNHKEHLTTYDKIVSVEENIHSRLDRTDDRLEKIDNKIDGHIIWHLDRD